MWYSDKDVEVLKKDFPLIVGAQTEVLRKRASEIVSITKDIRDLAFVLLELMWAYDGVGLAAPQIWQSLRMFAYTQRDTTKKERELLEEGVMINPKIVHFWSEQVVDKEGCLSLPWIEWEVPRSKAITIAYTNLKGKQIVKKATWYNARILQHEFDHLDGVLYIDRAVRVWEKKK